MIDNEMQAWLIEINTNPCLELSSGLLSRIIPALLDNTLRIAVDPIFGSCNWNKSKQLLQGNSLFNNKYELIFDEVLERSNYNSELNPKLSSEEDSENDQP